MTDPNQKRMTAEERTRELFSLWHAEHWPLFCKRMCEIVDEACAEAREEAARDAIIEFCEGEDSQAAEIERKGYTKGFSDGSRQMREKAINYLTAHGCDEDSKFVRGILALDLEGK